MRVPPRILVVDDTIEVRTLVCRILEAQGYDVIEKSDALHAVEACDEAQGEIDLLVTDIKMPEMDGMELAQRLTTSWPEIRVLFISGLCEESEVQKNMEKGYGFLSKPFMPHVLVEAVEKALAPAKKNPHSECRQAKGNEQTG